MRRIDIIKDGKGGYKEVDLGPVVPRQPTTKGPKKFTIEVHHKRLGKKGADLPEWAFEHPDWTITGQSQKRGEAMNAMVDRCWRLMDEGMTAKEAVRDTVALVTSRLNVSKLYKDLPATLYLKLRKGKIGGPKPAR
jgi:hypothetical protein